MGIQVAISHRTTYIYDRAVKVWPQIIRLRPAAHSRTKVKAYSLNISPSHHFINWMQDPFGNYQARVTFTDLVKEFKIDVEVIADLVTINPFDFFLEEYAESYPFNYDELLLKELQAYLVVEDNGPLLEMLYQNCQQYKGQITVDFLVAINTHIYKHLDYTIRMETGVQPCELTLEKKLGSCRDFAWVLVQLLRKFGLAARFVSGYLVQLKPDIESKTGPSGPDQDFTDLHAWAEVFIPGAGWIGLDATSGLFASEGHIPLACTPHPRSAAPVTGATEKTEVKFEFDNSVDRIQQAPRVTKPYTNAQWTQIKALGHSVDQILQEGDVRLTMGGEPTFISESDMESDQWNTTADGDDKRVMGMELCHKLKDVFAKQGFLHCGQGKWYPGEAIPRWQYAFYWRKDGSPLWSDPTLLADPTKSGKLTTADGSSFITRLATYLGISTSYVQTAYEDRAYYEWEKSNLPNNHQEGDEDDSMKRKTLSKLMLRGIDKPTGHILPLKRNHDTHSWESCIWNFRRDKLYLIPGNSEMGYRLPLDRISKKADRTEDIVVPANHFDDTSSLLDRSQFDSHLLARASAISSAPRKTIKITDPIKAIKSTLCVEVKDGNLYLFMPPIEDVNAFLDLLYSVEKTAIELEIPIIIEGYQAPYSKDILKLAVTPDPGVIEVNIHPAQTWKDILTTYDVLFEAAEEVGLGTNKFMLDGKHTGTGGGNHITLGGSSPAESPLLRRPDLLRSMLNFWQNHPGLSYLFSSSFIGPTSQAPRVDEGRPDIIYELEIAFKELENQVDPPFWMVDRIFRNLLTDITGNTHRAEFCIDKLYSPDSQSGRLGILELRGFDMPPHKEMCIVQLLLIRSLVAVFWKHPYKHKLINWGTDLHNKYMMHHFVKEDMYEVVEHINNHGIAFEKEWLDVFLDFKFASYGDVNIDGINMTLRAGIEPWIVLGEEMSSSGTSRFVDSSVERLEVMVEDFNPERYFLLCNSIKVPLVKTAYKGKYVAAIRYKAWAPYSALHPTIEVNSPLVFDIYDSWNERSVGGCTYHVMHPGGRSYDTFPINSLEAESRRMTRFWEFNHSPKNESTIAPQSDNKASVSYVTVHHDIKSDMTVRQIPPSFDFPHTLDLRRG